MIFQPCPSQLVRLHNSASRCACSNKDKWFAAVADGCMPMDPPLGLFSRDRFGCSLSRSIFAPCSAVRIVSICARIRVASRSQTGMNTASKSSVMAALNQADCRLRAGCQQGVGRLTRLSALCKPDSGSFAPFGLALFNP
jgi:hypothetical protein